MPCQSFNFTPWWAVTASWQPLLAQLETKMGRISRSKQMAESAAVRRSVGSCLHCDNIKVKAKSVDRKMAVVFFTVPQK
jgi:hypothetical protein